MGDLSAVAEGIRFADAFMWRTTLVGLTTPLTVIAVYWAASVAYIVRRRSKGEERRTRRRALMRPFVPFLALYVVHAVCMLGALAGMAALGEPGAETEDGAFLLWVTTSFGVGAVAVLYCGLYLHTTQGLAAANVLLTAAFFRDPTKVQALVDAEDAWRWGAESAPRALRGAAMYALVIAALLTFGGFTMRELAKNNEELVRMMDDTTSMLLEGMPESAGNADGDAGQDVDDAVVQTGEEPDP